MIDEKEQKLNPEKRVEAEESEYTEADMLSAAEKLEKYAGWKGVETLL